jgi:AcrR family transcriptional regulator
VKANTSRAQQARDTRRAILDAARHLFAHQGFFATGTTEIVSAARVGTRGALYHHFPDKEALFREVLQEVQSEMAATIAERIDGGDALEILASSLRGFLDAAAENPAVQRILLVDGPLVLGWDVWRQSEAEYGIDGIEAMLQAAVDTGIIDPQPLRALAHMLLAAIDEAALYIANSAEPARASTEVGASIQRLLAGLRAPSRPEAGR